MVDPYQVQTTCCAVLALYPVLCFLTLRTKEHKLLPNFQVVGTCWKSKGLKKNAQTKVTSNYHHFFLSIKSALRQLLFACLPFFRFASREEEDTPFLLSPPFLLGLFANCLLPTSWPRATCCDSKPFATILFTYHSNWKFVSLATGTYIGAKQ